MPGTGARAGAVYAPHPFGQLVVCYGKRRQQAHHIVARRTGDQFLLAQLFDQIAAWEHEAQPNQQPFPAHLRNERGIAVLDLGELLFEQERAAADPIEEAVREHDVKHGICCRHGERITAEGRAVSPNSHALAGFAGGQTQAPSGKPPPSAMASAMTSGSTP